MKRLSCALIALLMVIPMLLPVHASAVRTAPTRIINVVYDDSGSMYISREATWCQAKYAMEVFAAMLGDSDTMNVYYMSDYETGTSKPPRLVLHGSSGPAANVASVHSQKTNAMNTPFNSVRKAYMDLAAASADEKWLVVLTDGMFEDGKLDQSEIDDFFAQKAYDVNVLFLAMGKDAAGIKEDPAQNISFFHATSASEILPMMTSICNRIFNSNRLDVDASGRTVSFDVPMGELIVFAQGEGVVLNGLIDSSGNAVPLTASPIEIKYSQCDARNYNSQPNTSLYGQLAIYQGYFAPGDYTIDAENCKTLEVYYKPGVDVVVQLTPKGGSAPTDMNTLLAGEYTVSFALVDAVTGEKVNASRLLGDVSYQAQISNNGSTFDRVYVSGDTVTVEEGSLSVHATAFYLDYSKVETTSNYTVFADKQIEFTTLNNPVYTIESGRLVDGDPILVKATLGGDEFTAEQWAVVELPTVKLNSFFHNFRIEAPTIEKTDDPGVFRLYPSIPGDKPSTGTYTEVKYTIYMNQKIGEATWSGEGEETIHFNDVRPWLERNWDLFIKLGILAAILAFLAGYLPIFKNYLPRSLKKKPNISCAPDDPGMPWKSREGLLEKSLASTLIPYVPQTAKIRFLPKGTSGAAPLSVKAVRHRRMAIVNIKDYAGKDHITFNGQIIPEGQKKYETGAGLTISVVKSGWTYEVSLNR